jgi:phosphoribosylanthranilate isomerase
MPLQKIVKISNVTNLSDARYCAGMGVDMLGFSIDENNDNYTNPQKLKDIRSWVSGVQIVVEMDKLETDFLEIIEKYNPDIVQTNDLELLQKIKTQTNKPLILSIEANQDADTIFGICEKHADVVQYFLLESQSEITLVGDWPDFLQTLSAQFSILLGFGVTPHNVLTLPCAGVALRGGAEERPGYKNFDDLRDILELLEEE